MNPIQTERDIDQLLRASKALAVITAWNELGLFDALADEPRQLSELPADRRALEITVPVLKHLGLLFGHGDRVALSSTAQRLRDAGQLPSARNFEFLRDQARMLEVLRDGGPVPGEDGSRRATDGGVRVDRPEESARFLDMLYARSAESARLVHEWVSPLLPENGSVLDLGGGHGRYARTFADAGHRATLFDFPHVVEYAKRKHGDALSYIQGNFRDREVDFGGPYDLVFLSNIVHGEPEEENRSLLSRLAPALNRGGWLVVKDMFVDEYGQDPENAVFFGLTMLFYTRAGRTYALDDVEAWLANAGLREVQMSALEGFQLVRGRRP